MSKELFFGLVRKNGADTRANMLTLANEPEYTLYFINDSDHPVVIKRISFGGFQTYDDEVVMIPPKDIETDMTVEPHGYALYDELYADCMEGAGQYRAYVEVEGCMKMLEFYNSAFSGFFGSLIPCLNKYGRVIRPQIFDV